MRKIDVAIASSYLPLEYLKPKLEQANRALNIQVWPDPACLEAEVLVCLHPPSGLYRRMPRLRLVHCVSAGVDSLLANQDPPAVPMCRIVDASLAEGLAEYALWGVLGFHRRFEVARRGQSLRQWVRIPRTEAAEYRVGVMGLGNNGSRVARLAKSVGYQVSGWRRTDGDPIPGVEVFAGKDQLDSFLRDVDALVCALPLTPETSGLLNSVLFSRMKAGSALIHCGRGEQLVASDLIGAMASSHLSGALLDVFAVEPLPEDDPLWSTPNVIVTPHMASQASGDEIVRQITENMTRLCEGRPLLNLVDYERGY